MSVSNPRDDDGLLDYSRRAMFPISIIAITAFVPFVVSNVREGRYALSAWLLCVMLIFAANAFATRTGRRRPIPSTVLLLPIGSVITLSLQTQGIYGAFWCYPTVVFFYFVLSRRIARVATLSLLVYASILVRIYIGADVALRFAVSLGLIIVIMSHILHILARLQAKLVEQAIRDPLTGAYNRRQMEISLDAAIVRRRRTHEPASLVLFDIDHFKQINDELGHVTGDEVIKGLVSVVGRRTRKMDVLCRTGGEEFLVLLAAAGQDDAAAVAEIFRASVAAAPLVEGRQVTISLGVSELQDGQSVDDWIKQADDAMYRAKQAGRNRVVGAPLSTTAV